MGWVFGENYEIGHPPPPQLEVKSTPALRRVKPLSGIILSFRLAWWRGSQELALYGSVGATRLGIPLFFSVPLLLPTVQVFM